MGFEGAHAREHISIYIVSLGASGQKIEKKTIEIVANALQFVGCLTSGQSFWASLRGRRPMHL